MDKKKYPTILTVIGYFAFLLGAAGCLYLFLMAASGEFHIKNKKEIISKERNITSGYGYYLRRTERGR